MVGPPKPPGAVRRGVYPAVPATPALVRSAHVILSQPRSVMFAVLALLLVVLAPAASAQSALERAPNLTGAWVGEPGTLHFNFLHRFTVSDPPERKVGNSPTFLVAFGLPHTTLVGFNYATNSLVAPRYPNEWEFFARYSPLARRRGAWLDGGVQAAYNLAARSIDGEVTLARDVGPLRLLGAGRYLSDAYASGGSRVALGGGAVFRLGRYVALSGDVASLLDRETGEQMAWSAGLQLAIPYSPHTVSLHATNTSTGTLQGVSLGTDVTRYGFEFTIPITLRRYFGGHTPPRRGPPVAERAGPAGAPPASAGDQAADTAGAPGAVVRASMRQLKFTPDTLEIRAGTTIVWRNDDPLAHTVTADDAGWDSGLLDPGATWQRTFHQPGTYPFHCTPHPFMKGVVVVR
jgi:plastocyanin